MPLYQNYLNSFASLNKVTARAKNRKKQTLSNISSLASRPIWYTWQSVAGDPVLQKASTDHRAPSSYISFVFWFENNCSKAPLTAEPKAWDQR